LARRARNSPRAHGLFARVYLALCRSTFWWGFSPENDVALRSAKLARFLTVPLGRTTEALPLECDGSYLSGQRAQPFDLVRGHVGRIGIRSQQLEERRHDEQREDGGAMQMPENVAIPSVVRLSVPGPVPKISGSAPSSVEHVVMTTGRERIWAASEIVCVNPMPSSHS